MSKIRQTAKRIVEEHPGGFEIEIEDSKDQFRFRLCHTSGLIGNWSSYRGASKCNGKYAVTPYYVGGERCMVVNAEFLADSLVRELK